MIALILILSAISLTSGQSISGSTSKCGGTGADAVACGKATVLRGQSHIGIPAACFNKVDSGPCSQDLIRIYYDHHTYTCKAFSYSGCGGNANRFVSIKNCYKLCHPYYRQRFISLSADQGTENPKEGGDPGQGGTDGGTGGTDTTPLATGSDATASGGAEATTTPMVSTTTEPDRGVLYFMSPLGQKEEVKPEVQVVHEYDTFAQPQMPAPPRPPAGYQPMGSPDAQNMIMPFGQVGAPMQRSMGGGGPGSYGYLQNIQHENYKPMGGVGQGFQPNPNPQQKITSID